MDNNNTNDTFSDNDAGIEIIDLDNPTPNRTFHELRFSRRTRIWMIVITLVSTIMFLFFTFGSQLYTLVNKPQPPKIRPNTNPSSIILQTVTNGVVYAIDPDRMVYAIRANNGSLIWQSFNPDVSQSTMSDGITYTIKGNGSIIVAQGKNPNPLWIDHLSSSLAWPITIVGKRIYTVTANNTVEALNTVDGKLVWHFQMHSYITQQPAVSGDIISITTETGTLFTLRAGDGTLLWHHQLPPATRVFITNGNIIYADNNSITALHASNGSLAWYLHLASTPVQPLITAYGYIYVATFDGNISTYNGNNGSLFWRHHLSSPAYEAVVVSNTIAYVHTTDNTIYPLSALNGSLLWSQPVTNVLTFVVVDGTAYIITFSNKMEALHPSGIILWQSQLPSPATRPLIVSNGVLFTGSASGTVYAIRTSDSTVLWHYATQVQ